MKLFFGLYSTIAAWKNKNGSRNLIIINAKTYVSRSWLELS
jgi:hypothetical protein